MKSIPERGIWRICPSPILTELIAQSGFDFQILDCEHGVYDYTTLVTDVIACQANRCDAWIRVSGTDRIEVQRCLDLGCQALVFPGLASVEAIEQCSRWVDYAPDGERGFNPFVRSGHYGFAPPTPPLQRVKYVPIIETLATVDALDEVLKIPRIDAIYIGSYDLSAQLGVPGQMEHPSMVEVFDHIRSCCAAQAVPMGAMALTPQSEQALQDQGFQHVVCGVETHRIKQCFRNL